MCALVSFFVKHTNVAKTIVERLNVTEHSWNVHAEGDIAGASAVCRSRLEHQPVKYICLQRGNRLKYIG